MQVWTYSIIGLIIGVICNSEKVNIINIIKSLFPITLGTYWFISCYVLIYIFSPFIKKIVDTFSKRTLKIMISLMILIWCVFSIIPKAQTFSNEFIWLIIIYFIGAYIKKYNINILKNNKIRLSVIGVIIIILNIIMLTMQLLAYKFPIFIGREKTYNNMDTPLMLILTVVIFTIFKNIKVKNSKLINTIASTTFGIYLIHSNMFIR